MLEIEKERIQFYMQDQDGKNSFAECNLILLLMLATYSVKNICRFKRIKSLIAGSLKTEIIITVIIVPKFLVQ